MLDRPITDHRVYLIYTGLQSIVDSLYWLVYLGSVEFDAGACIGRSLMFRHGVGVEGVVFGFVAGDEVGVGLGVVVGVGVGVGVGVEVGVGVVVGVGGWCGRDIWVGLKLR